MGLLNTWHLKWSNHSPLIINSTYGALVYCFMKWYKANLHSLGEMTKRNAMQFSLINNLSMTNGCQMTANLSLLWSCSKTLSIDHQFSLFTITDGCNNEISQLILLLSLVAPHCSWMHLYLHFHHFLHNHLKLWSLNAEPLVRSGRKWNKGLNALCSIKNSPKNHNSLSLEEYLFLSVALIDDI